LQHAHQRGVLHRDIKPSNILLAADGQPLLLDFNLAQSGDASAALLGGTIAYAAPEHLLALLEPENFRQVDHRSDLYALGLVVFEMLTGREPFGRPEPHGSHQETIRLLARERSQGVPSARRCCRQVPWSLESILRKCLDPSPQRRYQQVAQF